MKTIGNFAAAAAVALLALGMAQPAFAAPLGTDTDLSHSSGVSDIPQDELDFLLAQFDKLGVDEDARVGLLEKYAAGEPFEDTTGAAPVEVEDYRIGITDYVRSVYSDGSVSLESIERPDELTSGISARGISGCSYSLSAGVATYSNCKVEKSVTTLTMWFRGGHWHYSGGHGASVTNTWDWDIQAVGGSCSLQSLGNVTSTQARLRASCTLVGGWGSTNPYVELQSTATSANVNANW